MNEEAVNGPDLPPEQFVVRVFGLADHAEAISETGKLYLHGLGVGSVYVPQVPAVLPSLYVVVRLMIPWQNMTEPFTLTIRALNADRTPIDRDPLFEVKPEVGRPPGFRIGDEANINAVFGVTGMPVPRFGTIHFHLEVDGTLLAVHQLKVLEIPGFKRGRGAQDA